MGFGEHLKSKPQCTLFFSSLWGLDEIGHTKILTLISIDIKTDSVVARLYRTIEKEEKNKEDAFLEKL